MNLIELAQSYVDTLLYTSTRWYFLASSVVLASISYSYYKTRSNGWSPKRFVCYLFPKSIYTHRSTKQDVLYLISFPLIAGLIFKPALAFGTAAATYQGTFGGLQYLFGTLHYTVPESIGLIVCLTVLFTLFAAMAADFMFYLHHYLLHKIGFLWEFHKVHHSAKVLTPLTDYRAHPLEILTYGMARGIGLGAAQGVFNYFAAGKIHIFTILGLNAVIFLYYVMGYPLRHSHVWISYGPIFSRIFISPAQHQIHHSRAKKHWDKNMGGTFALWDWVFGTLYIPQHKEKLEYGLSNDKDQKNFTGVMKLYTQPFKNNASSPVGLVIVICLISVILFYATKQTLQWYSGYEITALF